MTTEIIRHQLENAHCRDSPLVRTLTGASAASPARPGRRCAVDIAPWTTVSSPNPSCAQPLCRAAGREIPTFGNPSGFRAILFRSSIITVLSQSG